MPRRGLPICKCGHGRWWLHKAREYSSRIICGHCLQIVTTQSRQRHRLCRLIVSDAYRKEVNVPIHHIRAEPKGHA